MRLRSRLDQDELHDEKIKAGGVDKSTSSPSARKTKPLHSSEGKTVVNSPELKSKQSTGDLMFQMDEEGALSPAPPRKGKSLSGGPSSEDIGGSRRVSGPSLASSQPKLSQGDSLDERSYLDAKMSSIDSAGVGSPAGGLSPTPQKIQSGSPTPGNSASKAPWGSPVISGAKRDLKEIMAEALQSRVSNLTLGMSGRQNATTGGSFTPKLSQRERKKLQQQQLQESLAAEQKAKEARKSPWQTPAKQILSAEPPTEPGWGKVASDQVKTPPKPALTLRQTVAGVPPGSSPSQIQVRNVSSPLPTPPRPAKPAQTIPGPQQSPHLSTPTQPVVIQSIRHTPLPERSRPSYTGSSSGQLSLASILLQQQAEKDEIREAATAKHSLQEIQLEQEFQEWWDKESKRVMEAEAAAAAAKEQRRAGHHHRRSRGKNRGQRKDRSKDTTSASDAPPATTATTNNNTPEKRNNTSNRSNSHHLLKGSQTPTTGDNNSQASQADEGERGNNNSISSHRGHGHGRPRASKGKERERAQNT